MTRKRWSSLIIYAYCAVLLGACSSSPEPTVAPVAEKPQHAPAGAVEGWAVLAEKDHYLDVNMSELNVDYIDIGRMRMALEDLGWATDHIHDLREFDQISLTGELDWLEENADENDLVILYVTGHGSFMRNLLQWKDFAPEEWEQIRSGRRLLIVDTCSAAEFTQVMGNGSVPQLSIAAVDQDEYGWKGLQEEGLPIIGGVFTYYFTEALGDPLADTNSDGIVSVQEAALRAEEQQRTYMHEVVLVVPEFVEGYHKIGAFPEEDDTFPDVIIEDQIDEPFSLDLDAAP